MVGYKRIFFSECVTTYYYLFFFFFFVKTKKKFLIFSPIYYRDEESNYHYTLLSPPSWGWSTGFITTPLTTGCLPNQRLDPALPKLFYFATVPTALANCPPFPSIILFDQSKPLPKLYKLLTKHTAFWIGGIE
ncbi:hypothetical protein M9H77_07359 [Catharanthus roseus]|uniref:Uncharacterized protein n=1 Tax=Catharanthus roseus TaxID=4058 RepID=A0ACC0BUZ2_CATRO|nr:hypothetical protein M9H77_07359 [Catharanthus roseus]